MGLGYIFVHFRSQKEPMFSSVHFGLLAWAWRLYKDRVINIDLFKVDIIELIKLIF